MSLVRILAHAVECLENLLKNAMYICKAFIHTEPLDLFSQKSPEFLSVNRVCPAVMY